MINKVITSKNNTKMLIRSVIGEGGQGKAYSATTRCSKKMELVVKLFNESLNKKENLYRLEYLIDQQLEKVSQLFAPPLDVITKRHLGYYAKKAPGITLEEMLTKPELLNLQEAIILAISICNGLKILNRMGILYCDIHPGNFIVHKKDKIPQLSIIDFDNFHSTSSKIPPPSCIGHILYLAPETRKLFLEGKPAILNQGTDNFALACLLHNIILFKHQATGRDNSQDEFHKAMMTGNWNHDPSCLSRTSNDVGGYPSEAMSPNISRLFRRGFSLMPSERPGPQEWQQVLTKALNEIFVCNSCGGAFVIDISKESCPHCKVPFPILKLVFSDKQIPIDTSTLTVGRDNLGGDHTVSSKHAIFRRLGPETKVICIGSNPSFKWSSGKWIHLPNEKEIIVQENDRFRFSNLEVKII